MLDAYSENVYHWLCFLIYVIVYTKVAYA